MRLAILDFLEHGLRYVYPQRPGAKVRGVPTAHAAPPLDKIIVSEEPYVWPFGIRTVRSESIQPLHPKVPDTCLRDAVFYEYMALADAMRVGRAREKKLAIKELRNRLVHEE